MLIGRSVCTVVLFSRHLKLNTYVQNGIHILSTVSSKQQKKTPDPFSVNAPTIHLIVQDINLETN